MSFNNVSSATLLWAQVPVVPEPLCRARYAVFRQVSIDQTKLCAGVGGPDACQVSRGGEGRRGILGVGSGGNSTHIG